jgi:RNA polymerase sigma factor (sigma-70 family)
MTNSEALELQKAGKVEELILGFIHIARKLAGSDEDAYSYALLGLVKAANAWDGAGAFITYAYTAIRNSMVVGKALGIGMSRKRYACVCSVSNALIEQCIPAEAADAATLAKETGHTKKSVEYALGYLSPKVSLDYDQDDDGAVLEVADTKQLTRKVDLSDLTKDEADLVDNYFFAHRSLTDCGNDLGISYEAVRNRLTTIINKLKKTNL